jgi:hypothetical protein
MLPDAIVGLDRRLSLYGLTMTADPSEKPPGIVVGVAVGVRVDVATNVGEGVLVLVATSVLVAVDDGPGVLVDVGRGVLVLVGVDVGVRASRVRYSPAAQPPPRPSMAIGYQV